MCYLRNIYIFSFAVKLWLVRANFSALLVGTKNSKKKKKEKEKEKGIERQDYGTVMVDHTMFFSHTLSCVTANLLSLRSAYIYTSVPTSDKVPVNKQDAGKMNTLTL